MPLLQERLPAFTEPEVSPAKMRQLVAILERWRIIFENALETGAAGLIAPETSYDFIDDFDIMKSTSGLNGWDIAGTVTGQNGGGGRPGVLRLATGTGSGATATMIRSVDGSANATSGVVVDGGAIIVDVIFRLPTALPVVTTNEAYPRIGLANQANGAEAIYLSGDFDGGTFKFIGVARTASADTTTTVANGFTADINTWYHGQIVVADDGSAIEFFINGSSLGTVSTGIPTGLLTPAVQYTRDATVGTSFLLDIDLYRCRQEFSDARF